MSEKTEMGCPGGRELAAFSGGVGGANQGGRQKCPRAGAVQVLQTTLRTQPNCRNA